jgi:hypothetical protein
MPNVSLIAGRWLPGALLLLGLVTAVSCQRGSTPGDEQPAKDEAPTEPTPGLPWFEDVTTASGIAFHHFDSATPMHYIQETIGSGLAWIDYNNDGWPDLFCVQDGPVRPEAGTKQPTNKLYRNNGDGTFTDVTEEVGLARSGYGMGCAVGDYDNDGYDDLVITYLGGVVLYHNEPDGKGGRKFVDVTARAGLHNPHWATSCAWGDIDGDGRLDLFVCNYVEVDLKNYPVCEQPGTGLKHSCSPTVFRHTTPRLFRNKGDGTFEDISVASGIAAAPPAPGLGVIMVDLDNTGRLDIYSANDMRPQYLFHNQGGGRFVEKAVLCGSGLGPGGSDIAGMGVEAGDIDGSGRPALFVTNFQDQPNILYLNRGKMRFEEWSNPSGLGPPSVNRLGFGTVFVDADLDGHLDVAVANGHVNRHAQPCTAPRTRRKPSSSWATARGISATSPRKWALTSASAASAGGWPGRTTTMTGGLTWPSATTAVPLPCCATPPSRTTTGCDWNWWAMARRATATPSAPGWRSRRAGASRCASSTAAAVTSRPANAANWSAWARRTGSSA